MMEYKKLGFKCGLEIHQQLEGKKLFCQCPTHISEDDDQHVIISRKLRAVVGETGEIDAAAAKEQAKAKQQLYRFYKESCCLVEIDEEPPHLMNEDALYTTLQFANMVNASVVDEVQTMRKTVVDGSNVGGFQRTALVAMDGLLKVDSGDVAIESIAVEEDAAKIIERTGQHNLYNLSRLGIPLIEIATAPDIVSAEHCQQVAKKIGMLLRSTGRVKRGLGSIRQDVNVSIAKGNRVEIKGAQDLDMIPTLVDHEIIRQQTILELQDRFKRCYTKMKNTTFEDVTDLFKSTQCKFIAKAIEKKQHVVAFTLPNMATIVGKELQPGKRVGTDLSDYAKVALGIGGLLHSDEELSKYHLNEQEILGVKKEIKCLIHDAFVLMVGSLESISQGREILRERIGQLAQGVPKEVRRANEDGSTSYLRPMPGAARMYPETDTLPMDVGHVNVDLPELIDDKIQRYEQKLGLGKDLAALTAKGEQWMLFEELVSAYNQVKAASIAESLESIPSQLRKKHQLDVAIDPKDWHQVFAALNTKKLSVGNLLDVFVRIAKGELTQDVLADFAPLPQEEVEKLIKAVVKEHKGKPMGLVMGKAMAALKGRADGKLVNELVRAYYG